MIAGSKSRKDENPARSTEIFEFPMIASEGVKGYYAEATTCWISGSPSSARRELAFACILCLRTRAFVATLRYLSERAGAYGFSSQLDGVDSLCIPSKSHEFFSNKSTISKSKCVLPYGSSPASFQELPETGFNIITTFPLSLSLTVLRTVAQYCSSCPRDSLTLSSSRPPAFFAKGHSIPSTKSHLPPLSRLSQ